MSMGFVWFFLWLHSIQTFIIRVLNAYSFIVIDWLILIGRAFKFPIDYFDNSYRKKQQESINDNGNDRSDLELTAIDCNCGCHFNWTIPSILLKPMTWTYTINYNIVSINRITLYIW